MGFERELGPGDGGICPCLSFPPRGNGWDSGMLNPGKSLERGGMGCMGWDRVLGKRGSVESRRREGGEKTG